MYGLRTELNCAYPHTKDCTSGRISYGFRWKYFRLCRSRKHYISVHRRSRILDCISNTHCLILHKKKKKSPAYYIIITHYIAHRSRDACKISFRFLMNVYTIIYKRILYVARKSPKGWWPTCTLLAGGFITRGSQRPFLFVRRLRHPSSSLLYPHRNNNNNNNNHMQSRLWHNQRPFISIQTQSFWKDSIAIHYPSNIISCLLLTSLQDFGFA